MGLLREVKLDKLVAPLHGRGILERSRTAGSLRRLVTVASLERRGG
jgi:hypothetical protein